MKYGYTNSLLRSSALLLLGISVLSPTLLLAQIDVQCNAANNVRHHADWLQNSTRTATRFADGQGYGNVRREFDALRAAFHGFKQFLDPQQAVNGANDLADLDAGLDIIQEAFFNFEDDVAAGRPANAALRDMCQVVREASRVWLQEFNRKASRLGIR